MIPLRMRGMRQFLCRLKAWNSPIDFFDSFCYIFSMEAKRYKLTAVATLLNVNPWTIRRGVYAGKIPNIRTPSGRIFIPASWVLAQTGEAAHCPSCGKVLA